MTWLDEAVEKAGKDLTGNKVAESLGRTYRSTVELSPERFLALAQVVEAARKAEHLLDATGDKCEICAALARLDELK